MRRTSRSSTLASKRGCIERCHHAGAIQFGDPDPADTHTATVQNVAGGYLGTFTVDPVNEAGQFVAWHFALGGGEVNSFFGPSEQPRQQFYDVTIGDHHVNSSVTERVGLSVATAASDTFVFTPGAGQELVFNFQTQGEGHDRIDLEHFGVSDFQHLVLQAINNSHDTLVDLGHGDSVTLIGVQTAQLNSSHFQFGLAA